MFKQPLMSNYAFYAGALNMQAQRYWVERSFRDSKDSCSMGDYQARSWRCWNQHMALVMMAMLFMLEQLVEQKDSYPLLSC
jgi:SRSO17 transposase